MLAVLLGAASAAAFGAADFVGSLASKRIAPMLVTALAALAGVVALTIAAPFDGGVWHAETWVGGIATGVASCVGLWMLFSAYARGPMTTLAPIVAIVSTVVPMAAGLLSGETFSPLGWAAVGIGLVAIALVAAAPDARTSRARPIDLVKAAGAGALLGVFYIYLDSVAEDSGLTPVLANRITCALVAFAIVGLLALRGRRLLIAEVAAPGPGRRRSVVLAAVGLGMISGTLDATANSLFTVGLSFGDLAVLSVVSGLYPAVTIALAFLVLRERPNRLQSAGIVLALVALAGMALA